MKNGELGFEKSSPSVLDFYKRSSSSECEKSKKFSSSLSVLAILNHNIFSSLGVLIKLDDRIILKIEKREIKGN